MRIRKTGLAVLVSLAAACGAPSTEGLHQSCAETASCASGQECLHGGDLGGPHDTCEIPCWLDFDCPAPLKCMTLTDGPPGRTCQSQ